MIIPSVRRIEEVVRVSNYMELWPQTWNFVVFVDDHQGIEALGNGLFGDVLEV